MRVPGRPSRDGEVPRRRWQPGLTLRLAAAGGVFGSFVGLLVGLLRPDRELVDVVWHYLLGFALGAALGTAAGALFAVSTLRSARRHH